MNEGGEEYLRVSPFARSCHSTSLGNTIKATTTTTTTAFRLASFKYSELIPFALFVPTLFALPSCILIIPLPRLLNSVGFSIPGRGKREISASSYSFCFLRRVNRSFPSIYFRDPAGRAVCTLVQESEWDESVGLWSVFRGEEGSCTRVLPS